MTVKGDGYKLSRPRGYRKCLRRFTPSPPTENGCKARSAPPLGIPKTPTPHNPIPGQKPLKFEPGNGSLPGAGVVKAGITRYGWGFVEVKGLDLLWKYINLDYVR